MVRPWELEEEVREGFLEEVKPAWQSDSSIPRAFPAKERSEFPRWVHVPPGRQGSSDPPAALSFPQKASPRMLCSWPLLLL